MLERYQLGDLSLPLGSLGHQSRHPFLVFGFTSENKMFLFKAVLVTVEASSSTYYSFQAGM